MYGADVEAAQLDTGAFFMPEGRCESRTGTEADGRGLCTSRWWMTTRRRVKIAPRKLLMSIPSKNRTRKLIILCALCRLLGNRHGDTVSGLRIMCR